MNIKKTSWHYQLIKWFGASPSDSLCPYVRQILLYVAVSLFLVVIAVAIGIVFVWNPLHVVAAAFGLVAISPDALFVGCLVWAAYAVIGIWYGGRYLWKLYKARNPYQPVLKEPNIVVAYIKAKKEKFCPTLKFV